MLIFQVSIFSYSVVNRGCKDVIILSTTPNIHGSPDMMPLPTVDMMGGKLQREIHRTYSLQLGMSPSDWEES